MMTHSTTGLLHLASAFVALALGTTMLSMKKGTAIHRRIGYGYAFSMILVNSTAFGLYHLFGSFGPFHFAALFSLATLLAGMIPVITKKPKTNWLGHHMSWMYFSVIGLYAAFVSEVLVRIPGSPFAFTVTLASFLVVFIGMWIFQKKKRRWMERYTYSAPKPPRH